MAFTWPKDLEFTPWELDVIDRVCPFCARMMHICDHRQRHFYTLDGPIELICKLNHCPDPGCPGHAKTKSPEQECMIALAHWAIGWDVLCWIGHRRFSRHWAIPQIQGELHDTYAITISEDSITRYLRFYQVILAARQQDPDVLRQQYASDTEIILTIDGLQPEKGHETLYVVRELTQRRVWFAEPLISATAEEVRGLITKAKEWAESLGVTVALWLSDRQDAFVTGIAAEFPEVPHRSCANHFLRDLAKPVLEADSHAKVQMRKRVRGLRTIEQAVLKRQAPRGQTPAPEEEASAEADATPKEAAPPDDPVAPPPGAAPAGGVVLDYCAAVRGILNDNQGGPLHPPGLRMAAALNEVHASLQRNLDAKKGGSQKNNSAAWPHASRAVWTKSRSSKRRSETMSRSSRRSRQPSSLGLRIAPSARSSSKS
jgi:hypothetical protein